MTAPLLPDFTHWSPQELRRAEAAATEFIDQNAGEITRTFEKRLNLMRRVSRRMRSADVTFEERMMCLTMIQELAHGLEESAREFFEIGCQPSVANLIKALE